jgi:DNA-binding NtrC family response regulator
MKTILLALPEKDTEKLRQKLEKDGYSILVAGTYADAFAAAQSRDWPAVVMLSDWAMPQPDGSPGLADILEGAIPTMVLITETTYRKDHSWFEKLFDPPQHEYQHLPADIDQIVDWIKRITQ